MYILLPLFLRRRPTPGEDFPSVTVGTCLGADHTLKRGLSGLWSMAVLASGRIPRNWLSLGPLSQRTVLDRFLWIVCYGLEGEVPVPKTLSFACEGRHRLDSEASAYLPAMPCQEVGDSTTHPSSKGRGDASLPMLSLVCITVFASFSAVFLVVQITLLSTSRFRRPTDRGDASIVACLALATGKSDQCES